MLPLLTRAMCEAVGIYRAARVPLQGIVADAGRRALIAFSMSPLSSVPRHTPDKEVCEQTVTGQTWAARHDLRLGRLKGERELERACGDQIDPVDLNRRRSRRN